MEKATDVSLESGNTAVVPSFNDNVSWRALPPCNSSNSTLLFIAVECVKDTNDLKFSSDINYLSREMASDFEHVSPLDPNMSSTARYSPSYADTESSYNNSVVVQQMVSNSVEEQPLVITSRDSLVGDLSNTNSFESLDPELTADTNVFKRVLTNRYLLNQKYAEDARIIQLVQNSVNSEEEVQLMITDETTGVSYNISTQEYLVERCLPDDQQLLDALEPDSLLNPEELLSLDDSTLKSQLPEISDNVETSKILDSSNISVSYNHANDVAIKIVPDLKNIEGLQSAIPLPLVSQTVLKLENENSLINEKLPSGLLSVAVVRIHEDLGVIACEFIPSKARIGPLEGTLVSGIKSEESNLKLLVESENGTLCNLDLSSHTTVNWMRFVRKADNYNEQNLILSQEGNSLYYTAITNIYPKQELMVGYGIDYALKYNLPFLQPDDNINMFVCYECKNNFTSLLALQQHFQSVHQLSEKKIQQEHVLSLKDYPKNTNYKFAQLTLECQFCKAIFSCSNAETLKDHLATHGISPDSSWEEKFTILRYICDKCERTFETECLLKSHTLSHKTTAEKKPAINSGESKNGYKCPVCYKMFASLDRIQRHTLVHGSEESKPFKCEHCNKRFFNNSALACHLKTHNKDKKMFECPMCKESFTHVLHLKVHISKHRQDGKYTCPHCKKDFQEYSFIRKHIRAFHCDRKHTCPLCNKLFPTLDKLRMHSLKHSDHREFLCSDCGKQFKRKDKLKEHTKRMHADERENDAPKSPKLNSKNKKFMPKVEPTDYHRFIYKCHSCFVGFKRRGMLVNHLAKRHPDVSLDSVPELNLPILRTTRDYYCQYCDKVYKSSSKRKAHILKNHPGQALPLSNRKRSTLPEVDTLPNPTFSQTVGSITTSPQGCQWCHKQYASKAKLLQHQRKKHSNCFQLQSNKIGNNNNNNNLTDEDNNETSPSQNRIQVEEIKEDFQASNEYLAEVVTINGNNKDDEQYYRILSLSKNNTVVSLNQVSDANRTSEDSRLYHLLTARNGLLPPSR